MTHKLLAHVAPLATPQFIRLAIVALALFGLLAGVHPAYAYPIGGGVGGH
jgi:hypothetical protein